MPFDFNPPDGLMNTTSFPTNPASEAAARQQFMTLFNQVRDFINNMYPVNSIKLSMDNVNPGTYLGGTWTQIAQGKALVGVDPNDNDFKTAGQATGSKTHTQSFVSPISYTGTAPLPMREDSFVSYNSGKANVEIHSVTNYTQTGSAQAQNTDLYTISMSGSSIQPSVPIYVWKRTA